MSTQTELLAEVEAFLQAKDLSATSFGIRAVNDGKFVSRLRGGANMTIATIDRVRIFMRENQDGELRQGEAA